MKKVLDRYKALRLLRAFRFQVLMGALLFAVSVLFNFITNSYVAVHASNAVSDIFLDNLPLVNIEEVFFEGMMIFIAFVAVLGFAHPKRIPFMLKSSALFICVRSFFIVLTHLAPPPGELLLGASNVMLRITSGADLFFSGHTGYPFLMALLFWNNRTLRTLFLAISVFFAAAVLLGHLHYSIDVFSAFFITYGIFHIALWLFKKDHELFMREYA